MASARVVATTTATGSPTNRTTPGARIGREKPVGTIPDASGGRSRSAARNTPATPSMPSAVPASIEVIRPWATVARTNTAWRAPLAATSSTYRAAPVTRTGAATRRTGCPRIEPGRTWRRVEEAGAGRKPGLDLPSPSEVPRLGAAPPGEGIAGDAPGTSRRPVSLITPGASPRRRRRVGARRVHGLTLDA